MSSFPGMPARPPPHLPPFPSSSSYNQPQPQQQELPQQPVIQSINIAALSTLPKPSRREPDPPFPPSIEGPSVRRRQTSSKTAADLEYHLLPQVHSTRSLTGWRLSLAIKMHTRLVQNLLMLLLLCDVTLVVIGIVFEGFDSTCVATDFRRDCASCMANSDSCPVEMKKVLAPDIQKAVEALTIASLTILCLFGLELLLLLISLGWRFFTNFFYVVDSAVIAVSLWAEFTAFQNKDLEKQALTLLVVLRVWRFARIFHGVGVVVHDRGERRLEELEELVKKQKAQLESLQKARGRGPSEAVYVHDQRSQPYEPDSDNSALLGDRI